MLVEVWGGAIHWSQYIASVKYNIAIFILWLLFTNGVWWVKINSVVHVEGKASLYFPLFSQLKNSIPFPEMNLFNSYWI